MPNLEDALKALTPQPKPHGCKTCLWLAGQTATVQDYVQQWVLEGHSTKQLYDVLRDHGYERSMSGFKLHAEHVVREAEATNVS